MLKVLVHESYIILYFVVLNQRFFFVINLRWLSLGVIASTNTYKTRCGAFYFSPSDTINLAKPLPESYHSISNHRRYILGLRCYYLSTISLLRRL